jgi:hypothetical protein
MSSNISEEYFPSIFRVGEQAKQETSINQALLTICFLLGLFYDLEDGGKMFLRNVD